MIIPILFISSSLFGPCPHLYVTAECWLQTSEDSDENQHFRQADSNGDGKVDFGDFGEYAKEFPGGKYKPKPLPKPKPKPMTEIELKAAILRLFLDGP